MSSTVTLKTVQCSKCATSKSISEPYNVVWYAFTTTTSNEAREFFTIDTDNGKLEVTDRNGVVLDRDDGISEFTIGFRAGDNRYGKSHL